MTVPCKRTCVSRRERPSSVTPSNDGNFEWWDRLSILTIRNPPDFAAYGDIARVSEF